MNLVCRADATAVVGAGHVMRCATLSGTWQARGCGRAAIRGEVTLPFVQVRLEEVGVAMAADLPDSGEGVLVVDTYDIGERVACAARAAALRVLVDDLGEAVPSGYDAVWNPNAYGVAELYSSFDGPVLTGPEMVPIRGDLPRWQGTGEGRVGVLLGGGRTPEHVTGALARAATPGST